MKRLSIAILLAFLAAAPAFAQVGGGTKFRFQNDTNFALKLRLKAPGWDRSQDVTHELQKGTNQEFNLLPGWSASVEFGYGSGYQPVQLAVEENSRHKAYMNNGIPTFSSEYGRKDDSIDVGSGRVFQIQNDTRSELTVIEYGPGGQTNNIRLGAGEKQEIRLHNGWNAKVRLPDWSEMQIYKPQQDKKYVFYQGRNGRFHYRTELADSNNRRNQDQKLADALGIQVRNIGNDQLEITKVEYYGLGQKIRLAPGDVILSQQAIGALDNYGRPKGGMFLTGLKIRTNKGFEFDINLQNGGDQVWIR